MGRGKQLCGGVSGHRDLLTKGAAASGAESVTEESTTAPQRLWQESIPMLKMDQARHTRRARNGLQYIKEIPSRPRCCYTVIS